MQDEITRLCFRLIGAEDPNELSPTAIELKQAIRERFDAVRESALEIALLDKLVTGHVPGSVHGSQLKQSNRN